MNQRNSMNKTQSSQLGASLLGSIFYLFIFVLVIGLVVKVSPSVIEYFSIQQTVKKLSSTPTVERARAGFDQAARVDSITSISGRDLDILNEGASLDIRFAYRKEIKLVGPVSLVIDYAGGSK
jgi:hypothetical protein